MNYFTADPHFGHFNIIKYCNRPFESVEEMDAALIENWNSKVRNNKDRVYVLGDMGMMNIEQGKKLLSKLKGYKILIEGNHDLQNHSRMTRYLEMGFNEVYQTKKIKIRNEPVLLSHYPYQPNLFGKISGWFNNYELRHKEYRLTDCGLWLLHGHVHNTWKNTVNRKQINVGVDMWDFQLVSENQIHNIIRR